LLFYEWTVDLCVSGKGNAIGHVRLSVSSIYLQQQGRAAGLLWNTQQAGDIDQQHQCQRSAATAVLSSKCGQHFVDSGMTRLNTNLFAYVWVMTVACRD